MSASFSSRPEHLLVTEKGLVSFAKVEALGNDFVWILPRVVGHDAAKIAPWVVSLTDRTRGIGADGIILWSEKRNGMIPLCFFNRDGSVAEACGNGLRAVGVAGRELGFIEPGRVWFRIMDHVFPVDVPSSGERAGAGLGPPEERNDTREAREVKRCIESRNLHGGFVRMPNPHVVVFTSGKLSRQAQNAIVLAVRGIPEGGTNVGFAVVRGGQDIDLEVFERGVGWTLACGSGAAAAGVMAERLGFAHGTARIHQRGGCLEVSTDGEGRAWIQGAARLVFVGWWPMDHVDSGRMGARFLNW